MIRKVLFVDDDQIMLLALQKRLAKYSDTFTMVLAEDGFDAVRKFKEHSFSLVVLDLKMPRMDGVSLLTHISDKYPDIPVIIISGYRTEEMHNLAKEKEVVAYISKPFQVDDLAKVILSTLRKEAEGGTLHSVSPVVFLQLMEMESRTCTIRIIDRGSGNGGVLFFKEGKLYDARVGQLKGINAAYLIFTWEDVTLFIRNECQIKNNSINSSLQPIIMKAVGMKDEQGKEPLMEEDQELSDELPEEENQDLTPEPLVEEMQENNLSPVDDAPEQEIVPDEMEADEQGTETSEETLEDLELPDEVVTVVDKEQLIDKVRNLLLREVGERCGLEDIYYDNEVDPLIQSTSELGAMFHFGRLKVGYIDRGKATDEIILPGEPAIVIKVNSKCPQDKILQVLSTQM